MAKIYCNPEASNFCQGTKGIHWTGRQQNQMSLSWKVAKFRARASSGRTWLCPCLSFIFRNHNHSYTLSSFPYLYKNLKLWTSQRPSTHIISSSNQFQAAASMEVSNRFVATRTHIDDFPVESDFELNSEAVVLSVAPGSDDIILKTLYVSIDPYQINRMKSHNSSHKTSSFATPISPGQVIKSSVLKFKTFGANFLFFSVFWLCGDSPSMGLVQQKLWRLGTLILEGVIWWWGS